MRIYAVETAGCKTSFFHPGVELPHRSSELSGGVGVVGPVLLVAATSWSASCCAPLNSRFLFHLLFGFRSIVAYAGLGEGSTMFLLFLFYFLSTFIIFFFSYIFVKRVKVELFLFACKNTRRTRNFCTSRKI